MMADLWDDFDAAGKKPAADLWAEFDAPKVPVELGAAPAAAVPAAAPVPRIASAPEPLPLGEAMMERAKAGMTDQVAGVVRAIAESVQGPFAALQGTALGDLVAPVVEAPQPFITAANDASDLAQAQRELGSIGAIAPGSTRELIDQAIADPEGAGRYLLGIGAESVPAVAGAMLTRNPRAALGVVGASSGGSEYSQARLEGLPQSDALRSAATAALMETTGSKATFDEVLGGGSGLARRMLRAPLLEAAGEGATSGAQAAAQLVDGRTTSDEAALQATLGFLVGAPMGLGEAVLGRGETAAPEAAPPAAPPAAGPAPEPAPQPAPAPAPADAELDQLLVRNVLGDDVAAELGLADATVGEALAELGAVPEQAAVPAAVPAKTPQPAPAPATPNVTAPAAPDSAPAVAADAPVGAVAAVDGREAPMPLPEQAPSLPTPQTTAPAVQSSPAPTAPVAGEGASLAQARRFDPGELNVPLSKRGDIDAQIDRYKADEAKKARTKEKAGRAEWNEKVKTAKEAIGRLSDERLVELGRPYGMTAKQTRSQLLSQASTTPDATLKAMRKEGVLEQAPARSPAPINQPATTAPALPDILARPRAVVLRERIKAAGLKKGSPGYAEAVAAVEQQYEADTDAALAQTTFEQYRALNPATPAPVARQAWEALRNPAPVESTEAPLRTAVEAALGPVAEKVKYLPDYTSLPDRLRRGVESRMAARQGRGKTAALFDPETGEVYVFTDVVKDPKRAVWHAAHEIAGHQGLRAFLGEKLDRALEIALQNPTVQRVAEAIAKERGIDMRTQSGRLLAAEEALAELAAAVRTENWAEIETRYGTPVPEGVRERVAAAVENFIRRLKVLMDDLFGEYRFTDGDVRALLENAWQAAREGGVVDAAERAAAPPAAEGTLESTDYTPAQSEALAKAGLPVDNRSTLAKARDKIAGELTKLREAARDSDALKQAVFDRFHGLRAASAPLALNPEQDPYIAARQTAGIASQIEALMLYGAPKWDGGTAVIDPGTTGLLDALAPVKDSLNDWLGWMVGRRAQVLAKQGRENNLSESDINALLSLANGREGDFKKAAGDYLKIKNAVLDYAQDAGLIDPAARAAWDHAEYIPFYRAENEGTIGPGTRKGLAGQTSGIRTLKGGESALADPLANIIRNFTRLVDSANKNRATLLAVDQLGPTVFQKAPQEFRSELIPMSQVKKVLTEQGVPSSTIDAMPPAALRGVQSMLAMKPPSGDDVVRVMRDGKAEYYTVLDPLVLRSLTAFKPPQKNLAIKPLIWFKRLLTTGVTTTAEFVGANFIRDSGSAWVISDDRFIPGWDSLKGVANTLRNDPTTREMMMAGATFLGGNFYDGNPDAAAAALRRALRTKGLTNQDIEGFMGTVARSPLMLWDKWMRLSGAIENANRRAVYDAALRAGRTKTEAAFAARDLMDFAMQGDSEAIQFFADVLPFFNARLQGLYKLGRRAGTKEGKRAILLRGGVIALASAALYAWNMMAHQEGYDELEEWDKDAYWHIAPGTEYHTRIPKPFEIGLVFATAPERAMEAMRYGMGGEGDDPGESWSALIRALSGTLAFNPIPQAMLPIAEQWANKRFFTGRPIENMGDEQLLPEIREEWYTSDTMKALGHLTGFSPKRLEHLWNGYTAGLGGYVLDSSDWLVRKVSDAPERPAMSLRDWPVVGRFARGGSPAPSKYVTEFYDTLGEATQIEQSIKEMMARDRSEEGTPEFGQMTDEALALAEQHADLLGEVYYSKRLKGGFGYRNVQALRKAQREMSQMRDEADDIAMSRSMSAEEKRDALDRLTQRRNKLARQMVERVRGN